MEKFVIVDAKDIRKNVGIVVLVLKGVTEPLIRTTEQYKLDLENSDLDTDVHPSKLIGATVHGKIEQVLAGTTYVLDANSSLVRNGSSVPTVVGRMVNGVATKIELAANQKAQVGDVAIRAKGGTRLTEGFATFILDRAQHEAIAFNSKNLRASIAEAFAKSIAGPQPMPVVVESAKEVAAVTSASEADDIYKQLFPDAPVATESNADEIAEDEIAEKGAEDLTPEIANAIAEVNAAVDNAAKSTKK